MPDQSALRGQLKDIEARARANTFFRQEIETGEHTQIVLMSIPPAGEIGMEVHPDTDQVLYLVEGEGKVILDGQERPFKKHDLVLVHAGTWHNFVNTGKKDLKIITTYSPPHHKPGTVHKTKAEADAAEAAEHH